MPGIPLLGVPDSFVSRENKLPLETNGEIFVMRYWPKEAEAVVVAAVTMTSAAGAGGWTRTLGLGVYMRRIITQEIMDGRDQKLNKISSMLFKNSRRS